MVALPKATVQAYEGRNYSRTIPSENHFVTTPLELVVHQTKVNRNQKKHAGWERVKIAANALTSTGRF